MTHVAALLRRVLNARTVAVIGASNDTSKFGGRVIQFLQRHRFSGRIVPVNPSTREIAGLTAFPALAEAAATVDVALLAVPTAHLPQSLEDCGKSGVPCCVVLTADFAETGAEGAARERELVCLARRYGMRLIGPNCLGFVNPHVNLALTSSVALALEALPLGAIGVVSQSGSVMASMLSHGCDVGAGFSACVSVGNQADLEVNDFLEYFIEDESTRAICLYVEGVKDGRRFLTLVERCRRAGKPLLAVKAGMSEPGARITQSHTASLAGSHAVWKALCRDFGVIEADDPEAMIDCAAALVRFGPARCASVAAISPSGGTVAVIADRVTSGGLALARPSPETVEALRRFVPASRPVNPLDIGGLAREEGVTAAIEAHALLAADPNVGVVLIAVATTPQLEEKVRRWGEAALTARTPTAILFTPGRLVDGARAALRAIGCPYSDRMDDALRVVRAFIEYGRIVRLPPRREGVPALGQEMQRVAAALPRGQLTEPEARSLLEAAGIPVVPGAFAKTHIEACRMAEEIGYPVALKAVSRGLVHKSDAGAVKLGLDDAPAVERAWTDISDGVQRHAPEARLEGCMVERMLSSGVEMLVGAKWDPQFGAVVLVGAGGIYAELLRDTAIAIAPVTHGRAREMIDCLAIAPRLGGARGGDSRDVRALADAVVRVSTLACALGPQLAELDVNPLLVQTTGIAALDARARLCDASPVTGDS